MIQNLTKLFMLVGKDNMVEFSCISFENILYKIKGINEKEHGRLFK